MSTNQPWKYDHINDAVAAEIRAERAAQRITTRELAAATGLELVTMMRYLNGQRQINVERLYRFADALGTTPSVLYTRAKARLDAEAAAERNAQDAPPPPLSTDAELDAMEAHLRGRDDWDGHSLDDDGGRVPLAARKHG